jgi:hypothetical protein
VAIDLERALRRYRWSVFAQAVLGFLLAFFHRVGIYFLQISVS